MRQPNLDVWLKPVLHNLEELVDSCDDRVLYDSWQETAINIQIQLIMTYELENKTNVNGNLKIQLLKNGANETLTFFVQIPRFFASDLDQVQQVCLILDIA